MGVWIEILYSSVFSTDSIVTPCVGVWIEIDLKTTQVYCYIVTPCVGVWIENETVGKMPIKF